MSERPLSRTLEGRVQAYVIKRARWLGISDQVKFLENERTKARLEMEAAHADMEAAIVEQAEQTIALDLIEATNADAVPLAPPEPQVT